MKTKHTKGDWQIHKPDYETINIVTEDNFICEIPSCIAINEDKEQRQSEADANAKLIAAAPELLKALQDIVCSFENDFGHFVETPKNSKYMLLAKQAINKATQKL